MVTWSEGVGNVHPAIERVALITADGAVERRVLEAVSGATFRGLVRRWELEEHSPAVAGHVLARAGADIVVIDASTAPGIALAEAIALDHPELTTVVVAEATNRVRLEAARLGVGGVVAPTGTLLQYRAAVERAQAWAMRRGAGTLDLPTGRIITVLSSRPGSGKTTVATNLAEGLARVTSQHVGLVDFCGAGGTREALVSLTADFDFVIVDTDAGLDASALAAASAATDMVLVGALDTPSVREDRQLLDALDHRGVVDTRRFLVLNRADSRVPVDCDDVAMTLGVPIAAVLPTSELVPRLTEADEASRLFEPDSPVAGPLEDLVALFAGVPALLDHRPRFWRSAS